MVMIAVGCVVFLVASILVVCVLCIHSHRKRSKEPEVVYEQTSSRYSTATPSYTRPLTPQSPIYSHSQSQLSHRSLNTADYAVARHHSEQTLKSLRTTLRDWYEKKLLRILPKPKLKKLPKKNNFSRFCKTTKKNCRSLIPFTRYFFPISIFRI